MRRSLACLLACLTVGGALAGDVGQARKRFAVLEFSAPKKFSTDELVVLSDQARAGALTALPKDGYVVITRESMARLLREMDKDCSEGECEVDTLQNLGADYGMVGHVVLLDDTFVVTLKLFDSASGTLLATETIEEQRKKDLLSAVREAAGKLVKNGMPRAKDLPAVPPAEVRSDVRIETRARATLYVGLNPIGIAPQSLRLVPGSYVVSAWQPGRTESRKLLVEKGAAAKVALQPAAYDSSSGLSSAPRWTRESGSPRKGVLESVGIAQGSASPVEIDNAAFTRALAAAGEAIGAEIESTLKEQRAQTGEQSITEASKRFSNRTLSAARVSEGWTSPSGVRFVQLRIDGRGAGGPYRSLVGALGGGNVVAFGPAGAALEDSARLASLVNALVRLAAYRNARVTTMRERETESEERVQVVTSVDIDEKLGADGDGVRIAALLRDLQVGLSGEQVMSHAMTVTFDDGGLKREIRVVNGVLEAAEGSPSPRKLLDALLLRLDGQGVRVTFGEARPVSGVPVVEAALQEVDAKVR